MVVLHALMSVSIPLHTSCSTCIALAVLSPFAVLSPLTVLSPLLYYRPALYYRPLPSSVVQGMNADTGNILEEIKHGLDREATDIERTRLNLNAGSRVLKEKETKVRKLQQQEHTKQQANNVSDVTRALFILVLA